MKFGCVVGGGRLRRRSRSGEEEDFDKVEMEQEDPKKKILGGGINTTQEALASPSFPSCIQ